MSSSWKLIDEQRPPNGEPVLLATPHKFVGCGIVAAKCDAETMYRYKGVRTFTDKHGYWTHLNTPRGYGGLATHWTPLPELPKATNTSKKGAEDGA